MQDDIKPAGHSHEPKPEPEEKITNTDDPITINEAELDTKKSPRMSRFEHFKREVWDKWSKRRQILTAGGAALCLLAVVVGLIFAFGGKQKIPTAQDAQKHAEVKPTTVPSPLTGVQVDPLLASRPVTGIMIENSDYARPQSGLQDAGVVYEAIAEGGITRFLALFQDTTPQYIGPVRSLRPYFIDYAAPFNATITHFGGSPDALKEVQNGSLRNLDFLYNSGYYTRINSRASPHNAYTSFSQIDKFNQANGYIHSNFTPFERKADTKPVKVTAKSIDFTVSGPDFYVHYNYDAKANDYPRIEGGEKHIDLVSSHNKKGVRLKPKVVIALVVPLSNGKLDSSGAYYSNYQTSGTGTVYVFQDGTVTKGTWTKNGTQGQLKFTDSGGHALKLDAGQTWITLVSSASQVSYK